jgi:hypothetical protein
VPSLQRVGGVSAPTARRGVARGGGSHRDRRAAAECERVSRTIGNQAIKFFYREFTFSRKAEIASTEGVLGFKLVSPNRQTSEGSWPRVVLTPNGDKAEPLTR